MIQLGNRTTDGSGSANETQQISRASSPPDWLVRVINPLLKLVLRSPVHSLVSDSLLLLTVTGRKSGTEYTFPVGYDRHDDTVCVTSHGTNWWKNLRNGGQRVSVLLRGTERTGRAEVVEDEEIVATYLHEYFERNGVDAARRVGLDIRADSVPDENTLREAVDHIVLVRVDLSSP